MFARMARDFAAPGGVAQLEPGLKALWLFGPRRDLAIVGVPFALVALAAILESASDAPLAADANRLARWTATNILGNGTHVILTFLMFQLRPETMRSTPTLRAQVYLGIFLMGLVSTGFFLLHRWEPQASVYARALVFAIFGMHHTLSQNRGWWSLHNLRERTAGLNPMPDEPRLQRLLVPFNLTLILIRYFFVSASSTTPEPFVDLGQPALMPLSGVLVLLLLGLAYWAVVYRVVLRSPTRNGAKLLYLGVVGGGVALTIVSPIWGTVLFAGMHGLEYYFLSARMMEQRPGDPKQVSNGWIWPLMVASMLPFTLMGVVTLLRDSDAALEAFAQTWVWAVLVTISTATVLAHYWADALIYRFRLPEVRKVMLNRIGL